MDQESLMEAASACLERLEDGLSGGGGRAFWSRLRGAVWMLWALGLLSGREARAYEEILLRQHGGSVWDSLGISSNRRVLPAGGRLWRREGENGA